MKPGIVVTQIIAFQGLDGLDHGGRNEVRLFFDAAQRFGRVQHRGGGGAHQIAGFAGDDLAVAQLNGQGGGAGFVGAAAGGGDDGALVVGQAHFAHQQL